jgi:hypothetical protein
MSGTNSVNVPVKIDASALTKAIQAATAQTQETIKVDPSEMIKNSALKMKDLYDRFNVLKQLGAELHGKTLTDPIPSSLQIDEIAIKFRVIKNDSTTEPLTATINNVVCVGDISSLLSSELGAIVFQLAQEATGIKNTAAQTEEVCNKAKQAWEASNPDRRIKTTDEVAAEQAGQTSLPPNVSLQADNATE